MQRAFRPIRCVWQPLSKTQRIRLRASCGSRNPPETSGSIDRRRWDRDAVFGEEPGTEGGDDGSLPMTIDGSREGSGVGSCVGSAERSSGERSSAARCGVGDVERRREMARSSAARIIQPRAQWGISSATACCAFRWRSSASASAAGSASGCQSDASIETKSGAELAA